VRDLTEPGANIEAGSAILYGYMRSANGDLNAALKSYGGSKAYAQKVSLRVEDFVAVAVPADGASGADGRAARCEADRCAGANQWADAFSVPATLTAPAASGAVAASSAAASGATSAAAVGSTRTASN
jgi:hypothetical protein